jgi:hypothetical protein
MTAMSAKASLEGVCATSHVSISSSLPTIHGRQLNIVTWDVHHTHSHVPSELTARRLARVSPRKADVLQSSSGPHKAQRLHNARQSEDQPHA